MLIQPSRFALQNKPVRFGNEDGKTAGSARNDNSARNDGPAGSDAARPAHELPPLIATHTVKNQAPPLINYNLFEGDAALKEALAREGGGWGAELAKRFGAMLGREETIRLGYLANENPPRLKTHDRYGNRINEAEFHPAYHRLMKIAQEWRVHNLSWNENRPGAHVARAAMFYLMNQTEAGVCCPITMTHASIAVLRKHPEIDKKWLKALMSAKYDPRQLPAGKKKGLTIGMAMTEKQGGSDVRSNETSARPAKTAGPGQPYLIRGHKWFFSAPMSDGLLTLAKTEKGVSCFLVPRRLEDGSLNSFRIERLKDKLGNKSNASSEIEYLDATGYLVGEEGRGVSTIMEMVNFTRMDCVIGSAALMRQAVTQAVHHAKHRSAFGKKLVEQPAMQNVLADLALESEAAMATMMRLGRAFDHAEANPEEASFARIATAVSKYWVCKRAPNMIYEAMEAHGGNGYVEESMLPRLYREAPVNSIWEGSGNVVVLDVLRAIQKEPDTLKAFFKELATALGQDARYDRFLMDLQAEFRNPANMEARARQVVDRMALALQASLMLRHAPKAVAEAFVASRLTPDAAHNFGTLPATTDFKAIIERASVS